MGRPADAECLCRCTHSVSQCEQAMNLARFPRIRFAHLPTPLEHLPNLSKALNGPEIWIKRDDCTGMSTGGQKTRNLQILLARAPREEEIELARLFFPPGHTGSIVAFDRSGQHTLEIPSPDQ